MDRRTDWKETQSFGWTVHYDHDVLGNLTGRSYTPGPGGPAAQAISYVRDGARNAGKHAVTSALEATGSGGGGGFSVATEWGQWGYDLRGNQTSLPDGRSISWSAFDLPKAITGPRGAMFQYDAFGTRVFKQSADVGRTTTYVGGLYEKREEAGGTKHVFYVQGAEGVVAQVERIASGQTTRYLHGDHQGSIESLTSPTVGSAGAEHRQTDPFGNRLPSGLADPRLNTASVTSLPMSGGDVTLGFTGHEGDDELGFINMKGRMFDPRLGTFATADPFIQAPFFGQSYNRYAYVFGNPINLVDPSGLYWRGVARDAPDEIIPGSEYPALVSVMEWEWVEGDDPEGISAWFTGNLAEADAVWRDSEKQVAEMLLLMEGRHEGYEQAAKRWMGIHEKGRGHPDLSRKWADPPDPVTEPGAFMEKFSLPIAAVQREIDLAEMDEDLDVIAGAVFEIANDVSLGHRAHVRGSEGSTPATSPYVRPSGATTSEQRASVQEKPCVKCGAETGKQFAGHKTALVKEYYQTGTIDRGRMRDPVSVQPECPACSSREGAEMSRYSREMRKQIK